MTRFGLLDYFKSLEAPAQLGFAVYFDGALTADAVYSFEETARGHADENVNFEGVGYAMVVEFSTTGNEIVHEVGEAPYGFSAVKPLVPLGPRSRRSPLAERSAR